jgi:hypothetical protein
MAAGCQMLFVCMFIGGMIVRLYEDIANDTNGSQELAYRFLGIRSSEEAVVIMILASFAMIIVFGLTMIAEFYVHFNHQRLEAKFSVCTMDPPHVRCKKLWLARVSDRNA